MEKVINFFQQFAVVFLLIVIYKLTSKEILSYQQESVTRNSTEQFLYVFDTIGIKFPEVALAQAIHETNMFRSKICRENHNLFGMKESSRNHDIGEHRGHALYPHAEHKGSCKIICYLPSLYDYRDWQNQMMPLEKIKTSEEYIYYLQNRPNGLKYAEDTQYPERIKFYLQIIQSCLQRQQTQH